jgi:hypothetical protein
MRCFVHHDHEAVGICRACSKGLCLDCAVDLGHSLCCREHEQEAQEIQAQIIRGRKLLNSQRQTRFFWPFFLIVAGAILVLFGLRDRDLFNVVSLYGAVCLVAGIIMLVIHQRVFKNTNRDPHSST